MRFGNRKSADRFDEAEIIGENRNERGRNRSDIARVSRRDENSQKEEKRDILQDDELLDQQAKCCRGCSRTGCDGNPPPPPIRKRASASGRRFYGGCTPVSDEVDGDTGRPRGKCVRQGAAEEA